MLILISNFVPHCLVRGQNPDENSDDEDTKEKRKKKEELVSQTPSYASAGPKGNWRRGQRVCEMLSLFFFNPRSLVRFLDFSLSSTFSLLFHSLEIESRLHQCGRFIATRWNGSQCTHRHTNLGHDWACTTESCPFLYVFFFFCVFFSFFFINSILLVTKISFDSLSLIFHCMRNERT